MLHLAMRKDELLPFPLEIRAGLPVFEQLVYAVEKAVISGLLKEGDRFPSVRAVSRELRIHPNTVQKAISALVGEGLLEVHPGIGTVVSTRLGAGSGGGVKLLKEEIERLVVEAKKRRIRIEDLQRSVAEQWERLSNE